MSDKLLFLFLFLAGSVANGKANDFSVDWAAFRSRNDSSRVEFFYAIPYEKLNYKQVADIGLVGQFSVRFQLNGENGFSKDATIYKQVRPGSTLVPAAEAQRTFVDGFSVLVPPGRYYSKMTIAKPAEVQADTTGDTVRFVEAGAVKDSMEVPDFSKGLALSQLQLAAGVAFDTVTKRFSVIPNPTRRYGSSGLKTIYFYFEGYNLQAEPDSYEVSAAILSRSIKPETLVQAGPVVKPKSGTEISSTLGINVAGLAPGEYALAVELLDLGRNQTADRQAVFRVAETERPAPTPYRFEPTGIERQYYSSLEYIATPREFAYYNALSDSGKEAYLAWFWSHHNLTEFARRMETAEKRFRTARTSGLKTDRGRVYVKYGEPDGMEHQVIEIDRRPRAYWYYYSLGYVFVFIDLRGDNNYRLVYTDCPDEPSTGYEQYLTQEEEEKFCH